MNLAKFRSLAPEQQQVLVEAAREAAVYQRKLNRDIEGDSLAKMKQAGLAVVENVDQEPFRRALGDKIRQTYAEKFGSDILDAIDKARP